MNIKIADYNTVIVLADQRDRLFYHCNPRPKNKGVLHPPRGFLDNEPANREYIALTQQLAQHLESLSSESLLDLVALLEMGTTDVIFPGDPLSDESEAYTGDHLYNDFYQHCASLGNDRAFNVEYLLERQHLAIILNRAMHYYKQNLLYL